MNGLKQLLKDHDMTASRLMRELEKRDVIIRSKNTLTNYFNGTTKPTYDVIMEIAAIIDVPVTDVMQALQKQKLNP